ncbi:glycosyl transferase [Vibrio sp. 10N.261.51.A4]|uniref:glycosyl transferase n=1 Tax=Vibrio sp. 10N.261.51.A4 TaxID=3229674 RepID=UPI003550CA82
MKSRFIRKIKEVVDTILNLDVVLHYRIVSDRLQDDALKLNSSIIEPIKPGQNELIVSLTTYSKRIHDVHLVIETIAQQTLKPNRIILWLDKDEFTLDSLPLVLRRQIDRGLEIRFCKNTKSYKKLIPTLEIFPNSDILTIDDDILYPYDMIELMIKEKLQYGQCVIANMVHEITYDKSGISPYENWIFDSEYMTSSHRVFPVGAGGVLYPAGVLHRECLDVSQFSELAPNADDVWFKAMTMLNGYKSKKVSDTRAFKDRFLVIKANQDIGLFNSNLIESENDLQIANVFKRYKLLKITD